jgi:hypothetical protein
LALGDRYPRLDLRIRIRDETDKAGEKKERAGKAHCFSSIHY